MWRRRWHSVVFCLPLLLLLDSCGGGSGGSGGTAPSPTLVSISLTPDPFATGVGITRQLTATGTFSDSTTSNITATVTWQSGSTGVATVVNGQVTGVATGSTTILVSSGGISANIGVSVTANLWASAANMENPHTYAVAALLQNGDVLVATGDNNTTSPIYAAELYDPSMDAWSPAGSMVVPDRGSPTITELSDGRVLLTGGCTGGGALASTEIYDPSANQWSAAANMTTARCEHSAVLLSDGDVLVAGGAPSADGFGASYASAEVFDPTANTWTPVASMNDARYLFTMTVLQSGQVLVAGGAGVASSPSPTASAEIYDPTAGTWTVVASLNVAREQHTATLLQGGQVLVAAGNGGSNSAEVYDASSNTWTVVGNLAVGRYLHTATLLPNGQVMVAGGNDPTPQLNVPLNETELFDPTAGTWSIGPNLNNARFAHTATLLQNNTLLIAGGVGTGAATQESTELFW